MVRFAELVAGSSAALKYFGSRVVEIGRVIVRELWVLWATWLKETCIILACLATLYVTRTLWEMARTALPLWQHGTLGAGLHSTLAAAALLVESLLHLTCSGVVKCMVLVLLVHGSRVPLWVFIAFSGKRRRLKTVLVGASLLFSIQLCSVYYFGSHTVFARGVAFHRPLYDAAAANDVSAVSALLSSGAVLDDGNTGWPFEYTALHEASRSGHTAVVRMLLKHGAAIEGENAFGDTALALSSCNGEIEVVRLLLQQGADPNHRNAFGDTSLILASYHGHSEVVRTLLSAGAAVDETNIYGDSAVWLAVRQKHMTLARYLLKVQLRRPLKACVGDAIQGVFKLAVLPLKIAAWPVSRAFRPVTRYVRRLPFIQKLRRSVMRPRTRKLVYKLYSDLNELEGPCDAFGHDSWLHRLGYSQVVCIDPYCDRCAAIVPYSHHLVLTWGVWFWEQFDGDFRGLFDSRVKSDKVQVCREFILALSWFCLASYGLVCDLLDLLASSYQTGFRQRALYFAAKNMEMDELQRHLELGVSAEGYRDPREYGASSLITACIHGHVHVVRDLLAAGADIEVIDDLGRTPLMHAALHAQPEVVRMLLDAGANLEAQDVLLNTALMACFSRFFVGFAWDVDFAGRNRQVARMLMEGGADVEVPDIFGATVLTWSNLNLHLESVLDRVLPHHLYHVSMYDMLLQHTVALRAASSLCWSAAAAA